MSVLHVVSGFFGGALLLAALVSVVLRRWRMPIRVRVGLVLAAAAIVLLPVNDLFVAEYMRAAIGDLSITSQVLLAAAVAAYIVDRGFIDDRNVRAIMASLAIMALLLYPMALGLTPVDPYSLGYSSAYFATALLAATLTAWHAGLYWLVACVVLAIAGYVVGILESTNLWDYLIDPLVAVYALAWTLARAACRVFRRLATRPEAREQS
jgi:hypothetical protein